MANNKAIIITVIIMKLLVFVGITICYLMER